MKRSKRSKLFILILTLIVLFLIILLIFNYTNQRICSKDAKICPDGSVVGRNSAKNCAFDICPDLQYCDAITPSCKDEKKCYKFPNEEKPFCYLGNPCLKCESRRCGVAESYPMQVVCE